jgi:hypothetical protein
LSRTVATPSHGRFVAIRRGGKLAMVDALGTAAEKSTAWDGRDLGFVGDLLWLLDDADSTVEGKARPNINTGDPALDKVRLDLAAVDEGKLGDGVFRVVRVTRPEGLEGPYREELVAVCVRGARGGPAVAAQGWAPIGREAELGPIIVAACKTFEILP